MFKGEFVMGGLNPYVRGKKVKLYHGDGGRLYCAKFEVIDG
jgi:hypothetical protein